jgi:hypothetical protein
MLTIFATPKPFRGHFATIQRNAIGSWIRLSPRPQVILFGDSEGTREAAAEFAIEHVPSVETNEFGTPYLHALIEGAERLARHDLLCYVNGDIILTETFEAAVRYVRTQAKGFLMVGARTNLDLDVPIAFESDWRQWLRAECVSRGTIGDHTGIDLFVFPKGFYKNVPPLAIGRAWVDQWMIKAALQRDMVIDASAPALIVHQNHDYAHIAGGRDSAYKGIEAQRNLVLCGGEHAYTLLECNYVLTRDGRVRRNRFRRTLFEIRHLFWDLFVRRTVGIRNALRLRTKFSRSEHGKSERRAL